MSGWVCTCGCESAHECEFYWGTLWDDLADCLGTHDGDDDNWLEPPSHKIKVAP